MALAKTILDFDRVATKPLARRVIDRIADRRRNSSQADLANAPRAVIGMVEDDNFVVGMMRIARHDVVGEIVIDWRSPRLCADSAGFPITAPESVIGLRLADLTNNSALSPPKREAIRNLDVWRGDRTRADD